MSIDYNQVQSISINNNQVLNIKQNGVKLWGSEYGFAIVQINENDFATKTPFEATTYPESVTINGVTYHNSAYGFTCAQGTSLNDWATHPIVRDIKPIYFDASVNDFTTSPQNIRDMSTWGTENSVFTQFPFNWLGIFNNNGIVTIIFSDMKVCPGVGFVDYAFLNNDNERQDAFYWGCSPLGSSYIQMGGVSICDGRTFSRTPAYVLSDLISRRNISNLDFITYDQTTYIISLAILLYKTTDLQGHSDTNHGLGLGLTGLSSAKTTTSVLQFDNDFGMSGSTSDQTISASFFWIVDIYGNLNTFIGDAYLNLTNNRLELCRGTACTFQTSGDYTYISLPETINVSSDLQCVTKVSGNSELGYLPIETSGTDYTKGYCSAQANVDKRYCLWGGIYTQNAYVGMFKFDYYAQANRTNSAWYRLSLKRSRPTNTN